MGSEVEVEEVENPISIFPGEIGDSPGDLRDYELLNEIARGGMGVVYRARQISLQRIVALKMILTARLPGEADMKRFRAEAEAVASLEHPNIVPIHEVGEDEGVPYFTMKFIPGGSLAQRILDFGFAICDSKATEASLGKSEVVNRKSQIAILIAKIARAVHYAHQRGILHRDLKPSNILLDERDEPLVTDFGLAKQLETDSNLTLSGTVLGTPAYIAPEQAAGGKVLTTAVDIYSLGAIFYELLTGRPPFQADTPLETLRQVVEQEVRRPSSIHRTMDRDLETICLKCLRKDPSQRYGSAEDLAEDLERWLRHEPIHARRTGAWERGIKWARRHPASAALLLLALIAPALIIAVLWFSNARVREASLHTRENLYAADMFLADRALREGNLGLARATLAAHIPSELSTGAEDFRGFEWCLLWEQSQGDQLRVLRGFPRPPSALAIAPDGQTLAIAGSDYLRRWNLDESTGTELLPPKEPRWLDPDAAAKLIAKVRMTPLLPNQVGTMTPKPDQISQMVNPELLDPVTALSFSPDGRQVVSSTREHGRAARVWNMADGAIEFAFPTIFSLAVMSPTAPIVAVGSRAGAWGTGWGTGCVKLYDIEQCAEIWAIPDAGGLVAFSGDGEQLVTVDWDLAPLIGRVRLWSLPERRLLKQFGSTKTWTTLGFSPDGRWVALAQARSPSIEIWSVEQERLVHELIGHSGAIGAVAFSPDSQLLATAGVDQIVRLWSIASGELTATHRGHTDSITSVAFFPDGRRLASASRDGTVRIWAAAAAETETLTFNGNVFGTIIVSPDSRWWASASRAWRRLEFGETRLGSTPRRLASGEGHSGRNEGFDDGGRTIVSMVYPDETDRIRLEWRSIEDQTLTRALSLDCTVGLGEEVRSFRAAAGLYAVAQSDGLDGRVLVWSTRTGELLHSLQLPDHLDAGSIPPVSGVVISPDGALLAATRLGYSQIAVYSLPSGKCLYSRHVRPIVTVVGDRLSDFGTIVFLDFSPDSKLIASTDTTERIIRICEARTGQEIAQLAGHRDHTVSVAFSPDGGTLASTGGDGSLKLWHLPTRREVATLLETGAVGPVAFSPDGSMLIVGLEDDVRIFRAPTLSEIRLEP